jgi:hypothetical protein
VIFKGPLKDQAGNVKAAEGTALDDHVIESMDWLLEGIEGKLPK